MLYHLASLSTIIEFFRENSFLSLCLQAYNLNTIVSVAKLYFAGVQLRLTRYANAGPLHSLHLPTLFFCVCEFKFTV